MNKILVNQLQTEAVIGVYEQERYKKQSLLIDLELDIPSEKFPKNDNILNTIDYAAVCNTICNFISKTQFQLLETLAEHTAQLLFNTFQIDRCRLTIHKKPIDLPHIKHVAIQIERFRVEYHLETS